MKITYEEAVELIQSDTFQSGAVFIGIRRKSFMNYILYAGQGLEGVQRINRCGEVFTNPITLDADWKYTKYYNFVEAVIGMFGSVKYKSMDMDADDWEDIQDLYD